MLFTPKTSKTSLNYQGNARSFKGQDGESHITLLDVVRDLECYAREEFRTDHNETPPWRPSVLDVTQLCVEFRNADLAPMGLRLTPFPNLDFLPHRPRLSQHRIAHQRLENSWVAGGPRATQGLDWHRRVPPSSASAFRVQSGKDLGGQP